MGCVDQSSITGGKENKAVMLSKYASWSCP